MSWQSSAVAVTAPVLGGVWFLIGYRRSRAADKVAEQSGVITESRADTTAAFDRLNRAFDNLQEDNTSFRDDLRHCALRVETVTNERDALRVELARMYRKYNGDTPPAGTPVTKP